MRAVGFVLHAALYSTLMFAGGGLGLLLVTAFERWVR